MLGAIDAPAADVNDNIVQPAEADEAAAEPPRYLCCPLTLVSLAWPGAQWKPA